MAYKSEKGFTGKKHTEKTKNHLSRYWKGKRKGEENHFFGKTHTEEVKKNISRGRLGKHNKTEFKKGNIPWNKELKGRKYEEMYGVEKAQSAKKKLRNIKIDYVEKTKFNGMPLYPTVGKYEKQILDTFEKCIYPYLILRQYKIAGYFLDGYCPVLNLAFEIDESFHYKEGKLRKKDLKKQKEIEEELNCSFFRIKVPEEVIISGCR